MSLRDSLFQSIAALKRLTAVDSEIEKGEYSYSSALQQSHHPHSNSLDCTNEKSPFRRPGKPTNMDGEREEIKLDITRVVHAAYTIGDVLFWAIPLLIAALAATITGLLADSISFANNHNDAVFRTYMSHFNNTEHGWAITQASLRYRPEHLDYNTYYALLAAAAASTLGGTVVGVLLLVRWRSRKGINLDNQQPSRSWILPTCVALDTLMLVLTLAMTIYSRELWSRRSLLSPFSKYNLVPWYVDPPPGPPTNEGGYVSSYQSPVHYNLLTWNCRISTSSTNRDPESRWHQKVYRLCGEGIAARIIIVPLLILQGGILAWHLRAWCEQRKGSRSWFRQRLSSGGDDSREGEERDE